MRVKSLIVIIAALLDCSAAIGTHAYAGPNDSAWNPPARFDHAYTAGKLTITRLAPDDINTTCHEVLDGFSIQRDARVLGPTRGCSTRGEGWCHVWLPTESVMGAKPKAILRHELGHCNGWGPNHED